MRGLSLWQPMGTALFHGKPWENRPRATKVRGLVVVHAAARPEHEDLQFACSRWWPGWRDVERPRGALLGIIEIIDCKPYAEVGWEEWTAGPWCWRVRPVLKFRTPIPFKGKQGFFNVPNSILPDCVEEIMHQHAEAA